MPAEGPPATAMPTTDARTTTLTAPIANARRTFRGTVTLRATRCADHAMTAEAAAASTTTNATLRPASRVSGAVARAVVRASCWDAYATHTAAGSASTSTDMRYRTRRGSRTAVAVAPPMSAAQAPRENVK